jgi:hypothetical protein
MIKWLGRTDAPNTTAESDCLQHGTQAAGLARFIARCETPMTIGLQGEWGSGKTSLMRMINLALTNQQTTDTSSPALLAHWFDAWQYGAIGDDEQIGFRLLTDLSRALAHELENEVDGLKLTAGLMRAINRTVAVGARIGSTVGKAAAASAVNYATAGILDGGTFIDGVSSGGDRERGTELSALRHAFAEVIKKICDDKRKNSRRDDARVIIFIDDLDRIRPGRAVALLEILKTFLDVEHCVFVIACDYDVVREGVKEKLGITDQKKVHAFFDKIFQVPFQMPVEAYSPDPFIKEHLNDRFPGVRLDYQKPELSDFLDRLNDTVRLSLDQHNNGSNPRAVKRFLNVATLAACVRPRIGTTSEPLTYLLFLAVVAIQARWPHIVSYLGRQASAASLSTALLRLRNLGDTEQENTREEALDDALAQTFGQDWNRIDRLDVVNNPRVDAVNNLRRAALNLFEMIDRDRSNMIDDSEFSKFQEVVSSAAVVKVQDTPAEKRPLDRFQQRARNAEPHAKAFLSIIDAVHAMNEPGLRFWKTDEQFYPQIKTPGGSVVSPITFTLTGASNKPSLIMRLAITEGRLSNDKRLVAPILAMAETFREDVRKMGLPWDDRANAKTTSADFSQFELTPEALTLIQERVVQFVHEFHGCLRERKRTHKVVTSQNEFPEYVAPGMHDEPTGDDIY